MLKPGSKAPDIDLPDQNGKPFSLAKQGKGKILVYFYPKADTPGCTAQSCGLRDIADEIGRTKIVGISPDTPEKQKKFDAKFSLGFPLLADTENKVAKAWRVWKKKSMYGREYMGIERSAFLVQDGVVLEAWYKISPADTPKNLLEALGK
ncbi:MAG: peroxiredoxin [Actinobacteria bacterium]|nr:peroxiredoxin [Actinomycetota bacterium]